MKNFSAVFGGTFVRTLQLKYFVLLATCSETDRMMPACEMVWKISVQIIAVEVYSELQQMGGFGDCTRFGSSD